MIWKYDSRLCKPKFVDAKYDSENCTVYVHSTAIVMYRLAIAVNNHAIHKDGGKKILNDTTSHSLHSYANCQAEESSAIARSDSLITKL